MFSEEEEENIEICIEFIHHEIEEFDREDIIKTRLHIRNLGDIMHSIQLKDTKLRTCVLLCAIFEIVWKNTLTHDQCLRFIKEEIVNLDITPIMNHIFVPIEFGEDYYRSFRISQDISFKNFKMICNLLKDALFLTMLHDQFLMSWLKIWCGYMPLSYKNKIESALKFLHGGLKYHIRNDLIENNTILTYPLSKSRFQYRMSELVKLYSLLKFIKFFKENQ